MVEETISLCNAKEGAEQKNVKVIALKEISIQQRKDEEKLNEQDALEAQYISLKSRIAHAEQMLHTIEERRLEAIRNLQREIDAEKAKWEEEKVQLVKQAEESGFKAGYKQGKEQALQDYTALIDEANERVQLAIKDYNDTVKKYEEAIVQLAIASAEKILRAKLQEDSSHYIPIIQQAIDELQDRSEITVYVHPDDYPFIIKQKSELEQLLEDDEIMSIYMDPQLFSGDCLIKHPYGQLDVGIDSQLQQLKTALEQYVLENSS